jgi:hypothetical protein
MTIILTQLQPLLPAGRGAIPALIQALQPGQLLQGRVNAQVEPGLLRLQVGASELLARSNLQIAEGTRLTLQVVSKTPIPELRVVQPMAPPDPKLKLLQHAMARAIPPSEVRQAIAAIRQQPLTAEQARVVRQFEQILQSHAVRPERASPEAVRDAIRQSGIWLEPRLLGRAPAPASLAGTSLAGTARPAAGQPPPPVPAMLLLPTPDGPVPDTKLQLLQLLQLLRTDPARGGRRADAAAPADTTGGSGARPAPDSLLARLVRLIEGSVARIQLQQTAALQVEDGLRQAWQFDLPIRLPDENHGAMLRIQREPGDSTPGAAQPTWSVNLAFDFDSIGRLQCRVALSGERVSTTFWCERPDALARLEPRLPRLRAALEAQGLAVVHLAGVLGEPPEPLIRVPRADGLLDERA